MNGPLSFFPNYRFHSLPNIFSFVNELIGNGYGARYPWDWNGVKLLNEKSKYFPMVTKSLRECVLKSICSMANNRQTAEDSVQSFIYKSVR